MAHKKFTSPTGNIECAINHGEHETFAACDISKFGYALPDHQPCRGPDFAPRFEVGEKEETPSFGQCTGEPLLPVPGVRPLPYGTASVIDHIVCLSRRTGMVCWSTVTDHGFLAARAAYTLF